MRSATSTMPTGDLHPQPGKAGEGEWAQEGMARGEPSGGPGGQPGWGDSALTNEAAGVGKPFHPLKKGTFRLLMMRLKIVSSRENLGWGVAAGGFLK